MSTGHSFSIGQVHLQAASPTELKFQELYTWVVWQFPRKRSGGLMGAVRPPTAQHGWFPAIIHNKNKTVLVHGHVERPFDTPEAAVDYLNAA
jgi:hypothetical protein